MPKPRSPGLINAYGLKLGTGSWSASVGPTAWGANFAINGKSFLPSVNGAGGATTRLTPRTASTTLVYEASMYNEGGAASVCGAAWEYIAASKPPEIWIEKNAAGDIVQVWRSEREGPKPPISASPGGRVLRIPQEIADAHPLNAGDLHRDWDYDEKKRKLKKKKGK